MLLCLLSVPSFVTTWHGTLRILSLNHRAPSTNLLPNYTHLCTNPLASALASISAPQNGPIASPSHQSTRRLRCRLFGLGGRGCLRLVQERVLLCRLCLHLLGGGTLSLSLMHRLCTSTSPKFGHRSDGLMTRRVERFGLSLFRDVTVLVRYCTGYRLSFSPSRLGVTARPSRRAHLPRCSQTQSSCIYSSRLIMSRRFGSERPFHNSGFAFCCASQYSRMTFSRSAPLRFFDLKKAVGGSSRSEAR